MVKRTALSRTTRKRRPDRYGMPSPALVADEPIYVHAPARSAAGSTHAGSLRRAWAVCYPVAKIAATACACRRGPEPGIEPERIANRFARSRNGA